MTNIEQRIRRLEQHRAAPATAPARRTDEDLARAVSDWCETHELVEIVKILNAAPENLETITDARILAILQTAAQRREHYGTLDAWRAAQRGQG